MKTVQSVWGRLFARFRSGSRDMARQRLQAVLAHDRLSLSPALLEDLKEDILEVISRRLDIDRAASAFQLSSDGGRTALVASVPIRGLRRGHR